MNWLFHGNLSLKTRLSLPEVYSRLTWGLLTLKENV